MLSKACDYITDLRNANTKMAESLQDSDSVTTGLLRQKCERLKQENEILWAQLREHGINVVIQERTSDGSID